MEFQAVSGPKFTGLFSLNAGGIVIVCNAGRFWISSAFPEIFATKVWSGPKLTEILHVFGPQIFWGERPPPNFWSGIIKFSQILTMWQSFRRSVKGARRTTGETKKKDTSRVKHKPGGLMRAATVLCESCRTCFMFYCMFHCMFHFTYDRSLNSKWPFHFT